MRNGTDLATLRLIVEGPSTSGRVKNNLCASCSDPALSSWLRPRRASAIAETCLVVWSRHYPPFCSKWERDGLGHGECRHPTCYQQRTTSSRTFVRVARWPAERWHQKRAVAVFLTSSYACQCANQPFLARGIGEVSTIIALGSGLWGGRTNCACGSCLGGSTQSLGSHLPDHRRQMIAAVPVPG